MNQAANPVRDFLTIREAADEAQVCQATVRNWCSTYKIGYRVAGTWRVIPSRLRAMLSPPDGGADALAA